jgi:uncharacterized protein
MSESTYSKPLPRPNRLSQPYWDAAKRHELVVENCNACGHKWLPPADRCPRCLSKDVGWVGASGRGKVWSWIVMHQRYFAAFQDDLPYNVAYVELEEGPRLMTNLVECADEDIHCDMPVEAVFDDVTPEITLIKFRPLRS